MLYNELNELKACRRLFGIPVGSRVMAFSNWPVEKFPALIIRYGFTENTYIRFPKALTFVCTLISSNMLTIFLLKSHNLLFDSYG